ncbi:hypothetical protein HY504_02850 [Candidatus Wolfebacteria bacterium]|nr:hypothetical protein [Candidatus Wolfebacteria bacterium]
MRELRSVYGPPKRINESTYSIDVLAGSNITDTIAEAISVARGLDAAMQFEFNGVTVTVRSDSNPELVYRDWSRALSGYIDKNVGPHPNPVLTEEEKASDARIEAENERRRQERQAQYEAETQAKCEAVEARLANAPSIELADEAGWQKFKDNNTDGYGGAVVTYAERWARLMQLEMASGRNLEDVAEATSYEAAIEGITGFQYGCAVSTLAHCWKHGERLRR